MPLDAIDLRLLDLLQRDASLTNQALAAARPHVAGRPACAASGGCVEAGVDRAPGRHRCRRRRFGAGLTAIVEVTLDRQGAEHLDAFEARARGRSRGAAVLPRLAGPRLRAGGAGARHGGATTRWCSACSPQDANVRNVKSFFSVRGAEVRAAHRPHAEAAAVVGAARRRVLSSTRPFRYSPSGNSIVIGWSGAAPRRCTIVAVDAGIDAGAGDDLVEQVGADAARAREREQHAARAPAA